MDSRESLIDLIFTKCSLVYGRDFLSRWEGLDISEVKADWHREIGHMSPHAILYGLERLPADKPPTVLQFRSLCHGRPETAPKQIAGPASSSDVVNAAIAKALAGKKGDEGPRGWANRLRIREQQAERLTMAQRDMWRAALKSDEVKGGMMTFVPVDPACLPPAMREEQTA